MGNTKESASVTADREKLIDTLIAISVVAKSLAAKLRQTKESENSKNEK